MRGPYSAAEHEAARIMWARGCTARAIAAAIGRTPRSVYTHAHRFRDEFPMRYAHVTTRMLAEMRALREQGLSDYRIARRVGCSRDTVAYHLGAAR